MCGIAGFIGTLGDVRSDEDTLRAMMKRIEHRGPDDEGQFIDGEAHLGFRRLAIIDLDNGHQPMQDPETGMVITFNGEIYNYQTLRDQLIERGHRFLTKSDTEVLLHMYREYGADMLMRLRGMFAFVIWDPATRVLFGARDFFGIKPLYYGEMPAAGDAAAGEVVTGDTAAGDAAAGEAAATATSTSASSARASSTPAFVYGSEIKSILDYPTYERTLNRAGLDQYLSFQYSAQPETLFAGIYRLQPGHWFTYSCEDGLHIERYFDPLPDPKAGEGKTFDETVDAVSKVMEESVAAHMIADVEVGSLLSSGIDSTYIASLYPNKVTYTVGFETADNKYNEIDYAKESAALLGKENRNRIIDPEDYWAAIPEIMYYMDEPLADASCVALYFLDQMVAEDVKVVLSGEAADEFFAGYPIYHEPFSLAGYQKLPQGLRRGLGALAKALPRGVKGRGFLMRGAHSVEERFIGDAFVFSPEARARILKEPATSEVPQDLTAPFYKRVAAVEGIDDTAKMQYIDDNFWLPGDILLKADKMSMAHSLESRVPFLDRVVFDLARTLPLDHRMIDDAGSPDGVLAKRALRAAASRRLPKRITTRKKLGFPTPIRVWLAQDEYRARVEEVFRGEAAEEFFKVEELVRLLDDHQAGNADCSREIWTVYVFLIWYDVYFGNGAAHQAAMEARASRKPARRRA